MNLFYHHTSFSKSIITLYTCWCKKVSVQFAPTEVYFSTEGGFSIDNDVSVTLEKALIGNTGLSIEIKNAKFDFSRISNIPEATVAGYSNDFVGVYAKYAEIGLPEKWF